MLFKMFITGLLLFAGFRVLYFLKKHLIVSPRIKYHSDYILPLTELFAWTGFIIWVSKLIYESENYFVLIAIVIVFVLLVVPLFVLMRNFMIGVFLKIQRKVGVGNYVQIGEISGIIKNAGQFILDIEDKQGNIHALSYNHVRTRIIVQTGNNPHLEKLQLSFSFPAQSKVNELSRELIRHLLLTPWVAASHRPVIDGIDYNGEKMVVRVGVYALNRTYAENITENVLRNFEAVNK